jgi:hypothetical protein
MPRCLKEQKNQSERCDQWQDQGHKECTDWEQNCCDWWPCSWACDVISWICKAAVWVANIVCVAVTIIVTIVCLLWDVVTTVAGGLITTLESIFGAILSGITMVIELIEMIPGIGTLVRWGLNLLTHMAWSLASAADAFLGLIGVRPEKILRVCSVILEDEQGQPVEAMKNAVELLQFAADLFKRDANVRLVPLRRFQYSTGFNDASTVTTDWVTIDPSRSDSDTLDVPCSGGVDWGMTGSKFQWKALTNCQMGSWRRVLGYGAPVTCFFIRTRADGGTGCCLWFTDYIFVAKHQRDRFNVLIYPRTVGHELGHETNNWHQSTSGNPTNVMTSAVPAATPPTSKNWHFEDWQVLLIRASKHVTYF